MSKDIEDRPHDFEVLDVLALKSDAELEALASGDTFSLVERVETSLLSQQGSRVDRSNFVSRLRTLREIKRSGSRALGEAILEASDLVDRGQIEEGRKVYEHFLSHCDSPFYRTIAERQLGKLNPDNRNEG